MTRNRRRWDPRLKVLCGTRAAFADPTEGEHPLHGAPVPSERERARTLLELPAVAMAVTAAS